MAKPRRARVSLSVLKTPRARAIPSWQIWGGWRLNKWGTISSWWFEPNEQAGNRRTTCSHPSWGISQDEILLVGRSKATTGGVETPVSGFWIMSAPIRPCYNTWQHCSVLHWRNRSNGHSTLSLYPFDSPSTVELSKTRDTRYNTWQGCKTTQYPSSS